MAIATRRAPETENRPQVGSTFSTPARTSESPKHQQYTVTCAIKATYGEERRDRRERERERKGVRKEEEEEETKKKGERGIHRGGIHTMLSRSLR